MEKTCIRMKDRPVGERPYEKCLEYGPEILTDGELLAIILRSGTKKASALELAWRLLDVHPSYKGLEGLFHLKFEDFRSIPGIGDVKAVQLLSILELSRRLSRAGFSERTEFSQPSEIADYYMERMRHLDREQVELLLLNSKCCLLKELTLSTGDATTAYIPVQNIFEEAVRCGAIFLVLLHNHPSGDPQPSQEDYVITKRIKEAGEILGIRLLDHIIIGDRCYFSMKEEGNLLEEESES